MNWADVPNRGAPWYFFAVDAIDSESTISAKRARLVVRCACELLGIDIARAPAELKVPLSVSEFELELRQRYSEAYPELVFRTDATLERARLDRRRLKDLPRVVLRQGAPVRKRPQPATGRGNETCDAV